MKSPDITRKRLYLEAMEEILPSISKILGEPGEVILMAPDSSGTRVIPVPVQGNE